MRVRENHEIRHRSPTIEPRPITNFVGDDMAKFLNGVPTLQDYQYLGSSSARSSIDKSRTELLIMIIPYVVRDPEGARGVTYQLRRKVSLVSLIFQRVQGYS